MDTYRRMTLEAASRGAELDRVARDRDARLAGERPVPAGLALRSVAESERDADRRRRDEDPAEAVCTTPRSSSAREGNPRSLCESATRAVRGVRPGAQVPPAARQLPRDADGRDARSASSTCSTAAVCRVGVAICFESTFPYISRTLTASGAELLCVITNDAWFGRTAAAEQHAEMSVLRAVENRRYLAAEARRPACRASSTRGDGCSTALPIFHQDAISARSGASAARRSTRGMVTGSPYAMLAVVGLASIVALRRAPAP